MTRVAVKNAGDSKQVRKAAEQDRDRESQALEDLRFVLSTEAGRRVCYSVMERTKIYQDSFTGDDRTNYNEGRRSVGLWLLARIEDADHGAFLQMLHERHLDSEAEQASSEKVKDARRDSEPRSGA